MKTKNINPVMAWVVCLCAGLFFAYELMQMHMMNAISPMLMKDLSISATQFGLLSSTYFLADVIFLIPAGILLDRFSTRRIILFAMVLCIIGTVGFALANSLQVASIFHFFSGIGNGFCFLSCMILIARWFPLKKRAFVIGVVITVGMLGGVLAQTPFSLLAEHFTWRNAMLIDACIGACIFALIFLFVRDTPEQKTVHPTNIQSGSFAQDLITSLKNTQTLFAGLYTGLMNLPLMVIGAAYGSLFLTQIHGFSLISASFVVSMIAMGSIVGSPIAGFISDKMGKRKPLMLLGIFLSLIIFFAIIFAPTGSFNLLIVLFFLLGVVTSTQVIGYPVVAESNPSHLTGTSMGIAAVIIMGLAGLSHPISGSLLDHYWDGKIVNEMHIYSSSNFFMAFSVLIVGFVVSLFSVALLKETYCKENISTEQRCKSSV